MRTIAALLLCAACGADDVAPSDPDARDVDARLDPDAPPPVDAAVGCTGREAQPLDAVWTITSGGIDRTLRVHVPASYDPARRTPVVLDFHGYTMSGQAQEALTLFPAKADAEGFVVVHADGTGGLRGWNAGACCGTAASSGTDDVGFVDAMLAELDARLCVDPRRVYATGFSNGGFLSHRLACERTDRIAAIAAVSGVMGMASCAPSRAIPVLQIHGTADTIVPYNGSAALGFPSVATTVADWAGRNACVGTPVETFAQGDARCETRRDCRDGSEVALCTITAGGHTWPGGGPFAGGHQSRDLDATDAIWDFFLAHPLP